MSKKERIVFIIVVILVVNETGVMAIYAITTLFASNIVSYDNSISHVQSGNVQGAIDELYACASDYDAYNTRLTSVENKIYPVGSIYISVSSTNPSTLFGGTWEAFGTGKTLVGINTNDTDFDTLEESHGSKTVTLQTTNLPSHSHTYNKPNANTGNHTLTTSQIPSHTHKELLHENGGYKVATDIRSGGGAHYGIDVKTTGSSGSYSFSIGATGGGGSHSHTISITSTDTGSKGDGTAFSVMNPYITVYMWKRTA